MLNGYDYDDEMKFYVLVQRKERDEEAEIANIFLHRIKELMKMMMNSAKDFTDRLYLTLGTDSPCHCIALWQKFSQPIGTRIERYWNILFSCNRHRFGNISFVVPYCNLSRVMVDFTPMGYYLKQN